LIKKILEKNYQCGDKKQIEPKFPNSRKRKEKDEIKICVLKCSKKKKEN